MPLSSKSFVQATAALLLVGLLALLAIVGTNIFLVERSQAYLDEVTEGRLARRAAIDLRYALLTAETSQRGYIITGDTSYIEPYSDAVAVIPSYLEALDDILRTNEQLVGSLDQLRADTSVKLEELGETLSLAQAGSDAGAVERIVRGRGKEAMDGARAFIDDLIISIDQHLADSVASQSSTNSALRMVAILGGLIILGVVGGAFWAVLSYTKELATARAAVEKANADLEERVTERTTELRKANEEIQRFAYIVTHDLRAPLVNVMGFTSELEAGVKSVKAYMEAHPPIDDNPVFDEARTAAVEELPEAVTFIRAATRKMDGLINAILKISREGRRQLRPEQVNLADIANASAAAIHHQVADGGGDVKTEINVNAIVTDKLSIEQVLGNLLDNAVKYQNPDRKLRVTIRANHVSGNRVLIDVEDNGRGIAPTDHERVFELFRRSGTQTKPGEGIGLAHVRTMVRSLGGEITLTSTMGEGTTFHINLPRDVRAYLRSNGQ
jgi:signal transduction histidine kinase